ncbi:hypothetical protein ZIOFF_069737 [Zingiber officinale]|uniref:Uncharacterized protein n=1 Tax=Zingiber officinale TaxID=94328 RepID=A0A8J5CCT3_ZINOF|nr:hypothetical protein ZIOFF_069737 [Zingiber officinale]
MVIRRLTTTMGYERWPQDSTDEGQHTGFYRRERETGASCKGGQRLSLMDEEGSVTTLTPRVPYLLETDKATVEMECMEEGYLAKIIHGDGSKEIKVGEEEGDIEKFKDYKVSESAGPTEVQPLSEPAQSKKDICCAFLYSTAEFSHEGVSLLESWNNFKAWLAWCSRLAVGKVAKMLWVADGDGCGIVSAKGGARVPKAREGKRGIRQGRAMALTRG